MADTSTTPVRFGLSNVYYAVWDDTKSSYETPVRIPGAVSLSLSREGDSSTKYADNVPVFTQNVNAGYSGTLTITAANDTLLKELVGYVEDTNGMVIEDANGKQKTFALLYEVDSNIEPQRFVFYNCTLSRPEQEANTTTDTTDPDDQSLDITMIPRDFTHDNTTISAVKAHMTKTSENEANYNKFFTSVITPYATIA